MVKVSVDGRKVTSVPGLVVPGIAGLDAAARRRRHGVKLISWILPLRRIFSFSQTDSALTTETPTPCRPPETL